MQPILKINLTTGETSEYKIPTDWERDYLGGASLAARILFTSLTRELDPFSPESPLLFLNAGVGLFILMVPLFWVWVWWFRRDLIDTMTMLMQGTVCILMWALGHNSFIRIYITYRQLSGQMITTMYLPHGGLEMLAFVLAGTSAFLCIDALKTYLQENGNTQTLHPGDICLFILGYVWKMGLLVFFLMAIAAAIECWVTPVLVKSAFDAALLNTL